MMKLSLFFMIGLTVVIAMGLRWREGRLPLVPQRKRMDILARGKRGFDRWVTAAALAALFTLLVFGGLYWLRIWQGG